MTVQCQYTMCFIKKEDEILLLNREKSSWMGRWNGLGGRIEPGETPHESALREVEEEAGLRLATMTYRGRMIWTLEDGTRGGMHLFWTELPANYPYPATPIKIDEGILDWKKISWILHPENMGLAVNVVKCLPFLLADGKNYEFHNVWEGGELKKFEFCELKGGE
ncbi:NUDIX hydrolase [Laceyella putida]|uniref:NUDIX domain-containing protein n=1 Tax=Laceyella putida TaxID=110101 RepID=A0ABW2RHP6_9BACL